jgi:hypothetical protein
MKTFTVSLGGIAVIAALVVSVACGEKTSAATDPATLGNLAAAIDGVLPQEADRLLANEGHDETSFRLAVEEIMEDSERVVIFSEAYKNSTH